MNNFELCRGVCNPHGKIMGVGIIERAKLVALYAQPGTPMPNEEEFEKLFFQTEVIASMTKTNVSLFGEPKFFNLSFDNVDLYFFLLSRYGRKGILALQIMQLYDHEEIVSKVGGYLEQNL